MKFLIFGGDGYIGRVLQDELRKTKHDYRVIDNNLLGLTEYNNNVVFGDTTEPLTFNDIDIKNYDIIVNMAAVVGDPACLIDTRFTLQNNCVGTRNVVELANKFHKKIIHFSTCSLYGAENCSLDEPLTEESKTFPIDFYGQTKYQQERFVTELANDYCVFRLGTAYGQSPRMRYDLVIPTFTAKIANKETLEVFGGNQYRPFVHIRDVARAVIFAAENNLKGVYNLANENLTIEEVANEVVNVNRGGDYEVNNMITDPRNYIVSNKKILDTGFKFKYTVRDGIYEMLIADTVNEYKRAKYNNKTLLQLKKMNIII